MANLVPEKWIEFYHQNLSWQYILVHATLEGTTAFFHSFTEQQTWLKDK